MSAMDTTKGKRTGLLEPGNLEEITLKRGRKQVEPGNQPQLLEEKPLLR